MEQRILQDSGNFGSLLEFLQEIGAERIFLVCGPSIERLPIARFFAELPEKYGIQVQRFSDFTPNPRYEEVVKGTAAFRIFQGNVIVAAGGGSAMDVAKCIKLYSNMDSKCNYLQQEIVPNEIPLVAIPTTAGTGSEATRYAVIYYQGEKQSVSHISCIPSAVLLAPSLLKTLPVYQKKVTLLDALCHCVESAWSVNSTEQSLEYSLKGISQILSNIDAYLAGEDSAAENMLYAANLAGKAIDITQTTAGHAMSYKLTSLFGLSHGHSVAICLPYLWRYMIESPNLCIDGRGKEYVRHIFAEIAHAMGCDCAEEAVEYLIRLLEKLEITSPENWTEDNIDVLSKSVNPVRLKNNPIALSEDALRGLYRTILGKSKREKNGKWT